MTKQNRVFTVRNSFKKGPIGAPIAYAIHLQLSWINNIIASLFVVSQVKMLIFV